MKMGHKGGYGNTAQRPSSSEEKQGTTRRRRGQPRVKVQPTHGGENRKRGRLSMEQRELPKGGASSQGGKKPYAAKRTLSEERQSNHWGIKKREKEDIRAVGGLVACTKAAQRRSKRAAEKGKKGRSAKRTGSVQKRGGTLRNPPGKETGNGEIQATAK